MAEGGDDLLGNYVLDMGIVFSNAAHFRIYTAKTFDTHPDNMSDSSGTPF